METETSYEAIRRLQQKVDKIGEQMSAKKQRLTGSNIQGSLSRLIEKEIQQLNDQRAAIIRNIMQLKQTDY